MATKLSSALVAPSKVANILDWRKAIGAVMGLDVTRDRIGLAVAEHPDHSVCKSVPLNPISLWPGGGNDSEDLLSELEAAVRRHRVCAFVVNWPVNEGRMGERCGKVLRVLDSVVDRSNGVVTRKRPFALWCRDAGSEASPVDEWGRSTDFARAPEYRPEMRYSSKAVEARDDASDPSIVAADVLDQWVKNHWEVDHKEVGRAAAPKKAPRDFFFGAHSVDEYTSENASLQAALL